MQTRLTDTDIEAVLRGDDVREDLADLALAVEELRAQVPLQAVPWTPELEVAVHAAPPAARRTGVASRRQLVRWFAGLGVSVQVLMASTGAAAALTAGGWFGILPESLQRHFDDLVQRERAVAPADSAPEPGALPSGRDLMRPGPGVGQDSDESDGDPAGERSRDGAAADQRQSDARSEDSTAGQPSGPAAPTKSTPLRERDDDESDDEDDARDAAEDRADDERDRAEDRQDEREDQQDDERDRAEDREDEVEERESDATADRSEKEPVENDER